MAASQTLDAGRLWPTPSHEERSHAQIWPITSNISLPALPPPPPQPVVTPVPPNLVSLALKEEEQHFSLRWNDYQSSILSSFRHLRDSEDFIDVTLACDGKSFTAHKIVLSACSPYFRHMLKANPCQHPIVILRDVMPDDMQALLSFMYNGEVSVSNEQLPGVLRTARMLQIKGLADVNSSQPSKEMISEYSDSRSPSRHSTPERQDLPPRKRARPYEEELGCQRLAESNRPPPEETPPRPDESFRHPEPINHNTLLGQALEGRSTSFVAQLLTSRGQDSHERDDDAASDSGESDISDSEQTEGSLMREHDNSYPGHGDRHLGQDMMPPSSYSHPLLNLQGLHGLFPGPSPLQGAADLSAGRRTLDLMRVRATDPRPCPQCGKIYRSAHTLRTHLEDKHTVCPGYRCVLCGTVAKSRNSLHSHMSRQHRGISTKDLPVLPMPAPFDPVLASVLLAKAGVKVSPAELAARASPTGASPRGRTADLRLELKVGSGNNGLMREDPEDLSARSRLRDRSGSESSRNEHHSYDLSRTPSKTGQKPAIPFMQHNWLDQGGMPPPMNLNTASAMAAVASANGTGSALLDTYLQLIAEHSRAAAAASQAQEEKKEFQENTERDSNDNEGRV
ncbi:protein abrupt-like [Artemia franciscana]|uniref:Protein abrupt n=1 Tax=Artemia franciscana TaxID=6661 RepID=A0AA88I1K9_ARTSF|nr:hypothetical protein QYM36_002665 [Artemia franciscana]